MAAGSFRRMEKVPPHNHDGVGGMHMYVPWWKFDPQERFPRGYHIELWGGRDMPGVGMFHESCDAARATASSLKQRLRKEYGTYLGFSGRGEMIPNADSYCEIDPDTVDQWGIPVLRFHFKWADSEIKMAKDMQETFQVDDRSCRVARTRRKHRPDGDNPYGIADGGVIIHEVGTARMGSDPKTSVLNGYCQAHDVKNLFVTDGATFVTQSRQKSDSDHHGAVVARVGVSCWSEAKKGNLVRSACPCPSNPISRRDILKTLAMGAVGGSVLQVIPAEAAEHVHQMVKQAKSQAPAGKVSAQVFQRASVRNAGRRLRRHHSARRSQRRRGAGRCAGVHRPAYQREQGIPTDSGPRPRCGWTHTAISVSTRLSSAATRTDRKQVLDLIAYRKSAVEDTASAPGVEFFAFTRRLTTDAFYTSEIGIKDLQYIGNTFLPDFPGCPPVPGGLSN